MAHYLDKATTNHTATLAKVLQAMLSLLLYKAVLFIKQTKILRATCTDVLIVRGSTPLTRTATNDIFAQNILNKMVMYCGLH